jgi:hypothetical protein
MKILVLVTKVLPVLLALCHFINTALSYFYIDCIFLNYFASISILTVIYLYIVSYTIKLCAYYRMFLHYCVLIDVLNIIDYYIGLPITDISFYLLFVIITIIFLFVLIYLKLFQCK